MSQLDEPNVKLPLAASYNPRGVAAFTNVFTNALDQRKINCIYEVAKNSLTEKATVYLTKRPGVTIVNGSWGTTGQVAYFLAQKPGTVEFGGENIWLFSTSGNDIRASDSSTTTVIVTASGYAPAYVDKTALSGVDNLVVQLKNASNVQTVWFSTAIGTFTQITDGDFPAPLGKMEFQDGYAFAIASTNRIHNSDLNSLANWTATNFITKQIVQDFPIGLARLGNQIIAFGGDTMEVFVNAGNATGSPLQTVPNLFHRVGLGAQNAVGQTHYYANSGKRLYFFGRRKGSGGVFIYDGAQVVKISPSFIDKILNDRDVAQSVYSVSRVLFNGMEAIAFALDLTTATTQRWLMYIPEWNEWFEWNSTVFTPVNDGYFFLGVGANQHQIYEFRVVDKWQDDTTSYQFLTQFQLPKDGSAVKRMPMCGVVADTARSAQTLSVQFSDDDGQNWTTARTIDMTAQKKNLYRNGAFRDGRQVRLFNTDSLATRLEKFIARIDG